MRASVCTTLVVVAALGLSRPSIPAATVPQAGVQDSSTLDDQVELAVTVYNSDIALVRDVRELRLPAGDFDLRFMDVAATVNAATVHLRSLTEPARLRVLEQNYEYDLLEPDKLLRKYVGRDVTLVVPRDRWSLTGEDTIKARLISFNSAPVWKIGNEIVTGLNADHVRFPELPQNLHTHPTLIWTLANSGARRHRVEASYLAGKLSWSSDYVLTIARDDKLADLDGWVTLTNGSGTAFRNAQLQLVAGDLNRVRTRLLETGVEMARVGGVVAGVAGGIAQEAFSDYHLYTVGRKTTVNHNETKQVSMLSATSVPVRKRYAVNGQSFYYRNQQQPGAPIRDMVQVFYQFRNEARSGLGLPMPAGIVRVYQADSKGGVQFVGEDRIVHTPKDEELNLKIGNAFDVTCERKQTDFGKIATNVYDVEYELTLRNHKTAPIVVEVNEPIGATWRMLRSSLPWTKTDAWAAQFTAPIAADGTVVLNYRARITY